MFRKVTPYATYKLNSATPERGITSEYLLSYILPLFAFDFTVWNGVIQFSIYYFVLAFLCIRNNNVYANLLFECLGYRFYSCELLDASSSNSESAIIYGIVLSKEKSLTSWKDRNIKLASLNKPFYIMKK